MVICFPRRKSCSVSWELLFFTGTSYGQTSSDIEALHQAYHHIDQSLEDTDEQKIHDSAMAISKCLLESVSQNNDIYSKNVSTTESGKYLKGEGVCCTSM